MFARIFGGKAKSEVRPTTSAAIGNLFELEERLTRKQDLLEQRAENELKTAKQNSKSNKREALRAMRRHKQTLAELQKIDNTLSTIQNQRATLENAQLNAEVLSVMASASRDLKTAHNGLDVDQVHDLLEDIAEKQNLANEISEAISAPLGPANVIDESELLDELEQLTLEAVDKQLSDAPLLQPPKAAQVAAISRSTTKKRDKDAKLEEMLAFAS